MTLPEVPKTLAEARAAGLEKARDETEPVECGDYYIRWKRFCTEPEGHDGRHRNCEISWDDE